MIELLNIKPGDLFDYSIVYLFGTCVNSSCVSIEVVDNCGDSIPWPIRNNYFKVSVLVNLRFCF